MLSQTAPTTSTPAPPRAIGVNLLIFFAFALSAMVLLTQTLVSVKQAQVGVSDVVQPATSGILDDTALLSQLAHTNQLTDHMLETAHHINASLTDVAGSTHQIDTGMAEVRSDSVDIAASVAGIAKSSAAVLHAVIDLRMALQTTDRSAARIASVFDDARQAVEPLGTSLDAAHASLQSLLALIPSISQQTTAITDALTDVDGHLARVDANELVRLTNLLQLGSLLSQPVLNGN